MSSTRSSSKTTVLHLSLLFRRRTVPPRVFIRPYIYEIRSCGPSLSLSLSLRLRDSGSHTHKTEKDIKMASGFYCLCVRACMQNTSPAHTKTLGSVGDGSTSRKEDITRALAISPRLINNHNFSLSLFFFLNNVLSLSPYKSLSIRSRTTGHSRELLALHLFTRYCVQHTVSNYFRRSQEEKKTVFV